MAGRDRLLGGDGVFAAEALPHLDAVYGFAMHLTHENAAAEDLTQDTFLQALRNFARFEQGTNCRAWLLRICKNLYIDRFRARARRPREQSLEAGSLAEVAVATTRNRSGEPATEQPLESAGASERVLPQLVGDEVMRAVMDLSPEFRQALLMCDLDGLSYQEIADVLEVPIGTVRSRISRARSELRGMLEDYARQQGFRITGVSDHP
ncbi:MAG: sigma-70 family RNA polymerase sigma factor [Planctomycetota bacterium]